MRGEVGVADAAIDVPRLAVAEAGVRDVDLPGCDSDRNRGDDEHDPESQGRPTVLGTPAAHPGGQVLAWWTGKHDGESLRIECTARSLTAGRALRHAERRCPQVR